MPALAMAAWTFTLVAPTVDVERVSHKNACWKERRQRGRTDQADVDLIRERLRRAELDDAAQQERGG